MILLFIILFSVSIPAQEKIGFISMDINSPVKTEKWYSFIIDSAWYGINNDTLSHIGNINGVDIYGYDLPRRPDGTYRCWKLVKGKLQGIVIIRNDLANLFESAIKYGYPILQKKYTVME